MLPFSCFCAILCLDLDLVTRARATIIAETYTNCCVAFGIVDGTELLVPEALVSLLNTLFAHFDEIFTM